MQSKPSHGLTLSFTVFFAHSFFLWVFYIGTIKYDILPLHHVDVITTVVSYRYRTLYFCVIVHTHIEHGQCIRDVCRLSFDLPLPEQNWYRKNMQWFSREWRCSWSSAYRRCSNYIVVINRFITYKGAYYIRGLTVGFTMLLTQHESCLTNHHRN